MTNAPRTDEDLDALALARMSSVLGSTAAHRVHREILEEAGIRHLCSPDDLYEFATNLALRGGFEAAVAGLLRVAAVMRGAQSRAR